MEEIRKEIAAIEKSAKRIKELAQKCRASRRMPTLY